MRNKLLYIVFLFSLGCTTIDKLAPNQTKTFLKFYSETNQMISKDLAVLNDGFLILSTYGDSTLLLKTDLNGNKLWAQSYSFFIGNSVAVLNDGYIVIGDGINNQTNPVQTYMSLINTNSDGEVITTTHIGEGFQHGTAVTFSSANEIIALGYIDQHGLNNSLGDSIILAAYDEGLSSRQWLRQYPLSISSKSVYENNTGNLTWLSYTNINGAINDLTFTDVAPDSENPEINDPIFDQSIFTNLDGDLIKIPTGFAIAQTISENGQSKIGISVGSDQTILELGSANYISGSLTNTGNGLLIAASSDEHPNEDENARTDRDLWLLEVNYNGTVKSNGINMTYGGIGNEIPVRIHKANDGGYIVLGTSINSKGAQQTFLLKTNNKGELN